MPRCYECSKVVYPERVRCHGVHLRTWSSGPELISSADSSCDLCTFVRKEIEKVSAAKLARIENRPPVVLRNHDTRIVLENNKVCSYRLGLQFSHPLRVVPMWIYHHIDTPALEPPYDPVLRAHELLEVCMLGDKHQHNLCKPSEVDPSVKVPSLPRRLLDLSHGDVVLTLETQEWIARNRATADELSKYCTLSYRWGQQAPACMLRTQPTEDRVLFFVSMPQTFKDAIVVARGLGIRFLWIDALCIVQPSAHGDYTDWKQEGPRMWLVYQNAICTIAATCSKEPSDGFLLKVGKDCNPPCSIPQEDIEDRRILNSSNGCLAVMVREPLFIFSGRSSWYASVVASNLNRRGWVAQERLLSRRILHFTEEGIFWECQGSEEQYKINDGRFGLCKIGQTLGPHHASLMIFGNWLAFIELYSLSNFTLQADRLVALSSIARCVSVERFGREYYAGIWGSHLLRCLSWSSSTPCSATTRESCLNMAPSWSWASVPGGVLYPTRASGAHSKSLLEMIEVQTSLAEVGNQFGNIKKSALKLRALLCNMSLPTKGKRLPESAKPDFGDALDGHGWLAWDEAQNPSTAVGVYTVMPLGICSNTTSALYDALVITLLPSTGDEDTGVSCGVFRRVGHIYWYLGKRKDKEIGRYTDARSRVLRWLDMLFPNATEQTIVIV